MKVYDIVSRNVIKSIQTQSPILSMAIDNIESLVYLACENQNIYSFAFETSQQEQKHKQKKTYSHK